MAWWTRHDLVGWQAGLAGSEAGRTLTSEVETAFAIMLLSGVVALNMRTADLACSSQSDRQAYTELTRNPELLFLTASFCVPPETSGIISEHIRDVVTENGQ